MEEESDTVAMSEEESDSEGMVEEERTHTPTPPPKHVEAPEVARELETLRIKRETKQPPVVTVACDAHDALYQEKWLEIEVLVSKLSDAVTRCGWPPLTDEERERVLSERAARFPVKTWTHHEQRGYGVVPCYLASVLRDARGARLHYGCEPLAATVVARTSTSTKVDHAARFAAWAALLPRVCDPEDLDHHFADFFDPAKSPPRPRTYCAYSCEGKRVVAKQGVETLAAARAACGRLGVVVRACGLRSVDLDCEALRRMLRVSKVSLRPVVDGAVDGQDAVDVTKGTCEDFVAALVAAMRKIDRDARAVTP